ncbi:hypothetical protein [uncultured Marinobacter sp.]|uniref:hypothetical protein n=1 Tax=uncultured Marinobacter sp. TaxID=187379 RepID=UPI00259380D8|nr:hypothetical protein [uncultured Marinobacter sp.]
MTKDLTGQGDLDIKELDRKRREDLHKRNPNNVPEVTLQMWTLAHLTRDGQVVRKVVYGVVTQCLTDDYRVGEIVCSPDLYDTPHDPSRPICVSQWLRFECVGKGHEITISEDELQSRLPGPDADADKIRRKVESGEL